ncbi:hypothetical protein L1887_58110 [Cichorium endivia]|nr:hypothetical protein L1887_58110 [Cichorium endivia]
MARRAGVRRADRIRIPPQDRVGLFASGLGAVKDGNGPQAWREQGGEKECQRRGASASVRRFQIPLSQPSLVEKRASRDFTTNLTLCNFPLPQTPAP